ncbi:cell fate regulator YaaT (PSP1 superfamily) [Balneicella halophila]|uniref:Cell fate regulator YaaT (PSP1 superfamily) n=1 Tax=Balneicella halophila TaxID=1537566 RepID=A0A7L4UR32_BALHA|nr:regulatory iron-sulfur-containing complex subunit RicT [Balneicella halophila]PVX52235.1 cell fate regulator YaaT (PSP1 superfamily) [Balneicella halophila]
MESKGCCSGCSANKNIDYRSRSSKLKVYDWLENLPVSSLFPPIVEIHFKNTRKGYFINENGIPLFKDDIVAVEGTPGHDIGIVSLTGDLVFEKMREEGIDYKKEEFKKVYRQARPNDLDKWHQAMEREKPTIIQTRKIIERMGLDMKLSDVEYQGDNTKAIFYYIADKRVDFRQLIKVLADEFQIRVEMKQIGSRQEAGLVGGIGPCGRELCCSSWLTNFSSVSTGAARKQELSLNPQKLAGQCGKLKCCLNYELDVYEEARSEFPRTDTILKTEQGDMRCIKTDVLRQKMWYVYTDPKKIGMVEITVERAIEIQKLNNEGKLVEDIQMKDSQEIEKSLSNYGGDLVGQDSLNRFDGKKPAKKRRKKRYRNPKGKKNTNGN